ncbi:unnamed protein product [marine sediment metagenome]|uniref:Uncharacterized protein n=1 Tax=marine sediment metagenome TaxID=412755 RepID=X0XTZ9_9ZZZZ
MKWTHRVFELYPKDKPLSELEGSAADWVYRGDVMYCDVDDDIVVALNPWWRLTKWFIKSRAETFWFWASYNFWYRWFPSPPIDFDVVTDEEIADMLEGTQE